MFSGKQKVYCVGSLELLLRCNSNKFLQHFFQIEKLKTVNIFTSGHVKA